MRDDGILGGEDMDKAIQVFNFDKKEVRVVVKDGAPWWVAKDVCDVLGLTNSRVAIEALDVDEKGVRKIYTPGGEQEMNIISESGVYALIMRSNKPEARRFRKWVTSEVLPALRKKGSYSVHKEDKDDVKRFELAEKRLAIQQKNANARLAKIMQRMVENPAYPLTQESKQILAHEITHLTTGREHLEMLPDQTEAFFTATQVGEPLGLNNRRVMKLARSIGLVAPEGQRNEYGRWKMTKSPHSPHECPQWVFTEVGRQKVAEAA